MAVKMQPALFCDRCARKVKDLPEGWAPQPSAEPVLQIRFGKNTYVYEDVCDKCETRISSLVRDLTLDKDMDLPTVEPVDTTKNSFQSSPSETPG